LGFAFQLRHSFQRLGEGLSKIRTSKITDSLRKLTHRIGELCSSGQDMDMSRQSKSVKRRTVALPGYNVYSFGKTTQLRLENIKISLLTVKPLGEYQLL
jgi:hypothetical protein